MKYLVTGASGLLGSELVSISKTASSISSKSIDLTSSHAVNSLQEAIGDCQALVHCAARVGGVKANTDFVADFYDDNTRMNLNVLQACKLKGCKLVSIMSTCIYPDANYVTYPLTEGQLHIGPPHHSNFGYAYAKRALDIQSRAYRQQWGCNFVNVIPNNLYGLNDNYDLENGHVIPALIRKFYEAKRASAPRVKLWGSGNPLREFTFARDAAKIILWILENYDGDTPVNIGCTEEVSIKNLATMIGELVEYDGDIEWDLTKPEGQFRKPTSNKFLLDLGWRGDYTPLREGLRETVQSFIDTYPNVRGVN